MNRLNTYHQDSSGDPSPDRPTSTPKSGFYSFVIGLGIASFLGFGTFSDLGASFRGFFFRSFSSSIEKNINEEVAQIGTTSISLDATSSGTGTGTTYTLSHTTGNLTNGILLVGVSRSGTTSLVSTVTYNGISLTRLGGTANGSSALADIWYLVDPPTGIFDIVTTIPDVSAEHFVGATTYSGVDQISPLGAISSDLGTGTLSSRTISSTTGERVFDVFSINGDDGVPGGSQTELWGMVGGNGSSQPGAASVTMSWTGVSGSWAHIVTTISPAAEEICGNFVDDNNDGRTDEVFPGGVQTSMQLWLQAETGTNTTTNGSDVTSWTDQSINGYSANTDVASTDNPTFTSNAINFNPGINFDGDYSDDFSDGLHLGSDYIFANNEGLHVFMVVDPNIDAETDNYCFDFGLQSNGGYGMIYSNDDFGMYTNSGSGGINTELTHTEGDEPALIEFEVDFNDFQSFFRNGVELSAIPVTIDYLDATRVNESSNYETGASNSFGPVSIGRKSASVFLSNDGGRIFDGNISEVIVYNDMLSDADKEKVNSYLAIKYGITLNHDYMSSSGTTKKDITDGYANAIAGIGLDDCSGLNQKQSKSAEDEAIVTVGLGSIATTNQTNGSSFSGDGTYLIWGNDGTAINASWNSSNISIGGGTYSRVDRVWSFSEFFNVTNIALRIDVDDADFDLPVMPGSANGNYYLFVDDDGDFTNGGTTASQMSLVSGSDWEVLLSDPANSYFSFGINESSPEICNNGIDDDGDGLIDCADCDDCVAFASCNDNDNDGIGDLCDLDDDNDGIPDLEECGEMVISSNQAFEADDVYTGTPPGPGSALSYLTGVDGVSRYKDGILTAEGLNFKFWDRPGNTSVDWSEGQYIVTSNERSHAETPALISLSPAGGAFCIFSTSGEAISQDIPVEIGKEYTVELWMGILPNYYENNKDNDGTPGIDPDAGTIFQYGGNIEIGVVAGGDPTPGFTTMGTQIDPSGTPSALFPYVSYDILTDFPVTYTAADFPANLPAYDVSEVYATYPTLDPHWTKISIQFIANATTATIQLKTDNGNWSVFTVDEMRLIDEELDCDFDGDGIANHLDLDSDNDGIFDLVEAGHSATDANNDGIVDGAAGLFGANGLFDALETSTDSDSINYTIADSDADGTFNAMDIDADGDGCIDVLEAGFTDGEFDGQLGSALVSVDGNGVVTTGTDGYTGTTSFVTDATQQSGCPDTDNDNISNGNDLDDDNDGILDNTEFDCSSAFLGFNATWTQSNPAFDDRLINSPTVVASAEPFVLGSGSSGVSTANRLEFPTITSSTLADAIQNNEYVEFEFTTQPSINSVLLAEVSQNKNPISSGATPTSYGYHVGVVISDDAFVSQTILEHDFYVDEIIPSGWNHVFMLGDNEDYQFEPSTTYTFRVYFFNKHTTGTARFDDFAFLTYHCNNPLDVDSDGTYSHIDLDADGDLCNDVLEAGFTDGDDDGILGSDPVSVDANGLVTSGVDGYSSPTETNSETVDFLDNSIAIACTEICNNGIDDDGDGLIDCQDCDDCGSSVSCDDNDNDGVGDFCDLDDDNDGIPDLDECNGTFGLDGTHTASTFTTTQLSSTASGIQYDINLINGITFNTGTGPNLSNTNSGPPAPFNGSQNYLWLEINTDQNIEDHGTFTITFPGPVVNPTINFGGLSSNTVSPDWSLSLINQTQGVSMNVIWTDGDFEISGDTIRATENPGTNGSGLIEFTGIVEQLTFQIGHYTESNLDGPVRFATNVGYTLCDDIDSDGVPSMFDLDSDNDGIFDVDEAGHNAADANDDGIIDGAATLFGTNGLFDALETAADNGTLNYFIADSEAVPEGIYDAYELDSDGDGCNDTNEEGISDTDSDGIAGAGVPTVNASNGLVTTITYTSPPNNTWQNPAVVGCVEICDDGIDNDGDGDIDCADSDCSSAVSLTLTDTEECINSPTLVLGGGTPTGGTYSGPGVSSGNFNASIAGLGTHTITYSYTNLENCTVTATDDLTVISLPVVSLVFTNDSDCLSNNTFALTEGSPSGGTYSGPGVTGTNFDASVAGLGTHTITYTYTDGNNCTNTATDDITVFNNPTVSLNLLDSVSCVSSTTLELRGGVPSGGTFSGLGVVGTNFDASIAGVGTHIITYTISGGAGCNGSAIDSITVLPLPIVTLTLVDDEECVNNTTLALDGGSPSGGTYSGTGVSGGSFNASVAGLGTHTITYTYTDVDGCINTDTDDITVISLPVVNFTLVDDTECISSTTLALSGGSPAGGIYSGPSVSGGNFDASSAGSGVHTITYTFTDGNGCANAATDDIVVYNLPTVSLNFSDDEDCVLNSTFNLNEGLPAGGTYIGSGVSGTNFNASSAGLGTHTITYIFTDVNGCTNSATDQITVVSAPTTTLILPTTEACESNTSVSLSGGNPTGGVFTGPATSGTTFNPNSAGPGVHIITYTFTDANGCGSSATADITVYESPTISGVTANDPSSCGGSNGSLVVTVLGGTGNYEYRINSGTWQASNTFGGLSAGSYIVEARNDNGFCIVAYASNPVVLSDPSSPTAEINLPAVGCINTATNFTATDAGVGATYSWNFGTGATPSTASGIGPHAVTYSSNGSKTISLSVSLSGCTGSDTESLTVNDLPAVSLTLTDIEECVNSTTLTLAGGAPSGGIYSGTGVSGGVFDASTAGVGTHTITYSFTDANGCTNTATDDIDVVALPTVILTLGTDIACIDNNSLSLTGESPSGGTYSGTGVTGNTFNATVAGLGTHTITYTFTDAGGCTNIATDDITVFSFPTITTVNSSNPTTCGGSEGWITISASGGSGNYEYRLNGGSWQTSNSFTGLNAGNYNVFVRNDNGLCEVVYASNPVVLSDPPATIVNTAVISDYTGEDITCVGSSDGFAQATGSGGLAPYSYSWSNGQTTDILSNVSAGTYDVTVTDANGCQGLGTITLNDPPPLGVTATFTDVTCYGGSDGAIDVTATGGVGAYTYAWNDIDPEAFWAMDNTTDDITGNDHHATAIFGTELYSNDAVDGDQSFEFNGGTAIAYDDDVSFLESAFDEVSVVMWIKPKDLNDGRQMLFDYGGRTHGIGLRLNDDELEGSIRSFSNQRTAFEMTIPDDGQWHQVGFVYDNGIFTLMVDGVLGTPNNTGFGTIQMLGGGLNQCGLGAKLGEDAFGGSVFGNARFYEGLMDNIAYYSTALTTQQFTDNFTDDGDRTGLPAGDYKVYVYDLNGCIDSVTLTLSQPDSLALTADITNVLCNGESTGVIDLSVAGGVGAFTYNWSNGSSGQDIVNLPIGNYTVTVTDANGCTVVDAFDVNEPSVLTSSSTVTSNYNGFNISCAGESDGTGSVTGLGGTTPYNYLWSDGQTTSTLLNVGAGTYFITVTDANGCASASNITFTDPPAITVSSSVTSSYGGEDLSCVGASDGTANANASNGVSPYSYAWSNGQTGANLVNVGAGTYTVVATDANGCTSTTSVTLTNPPGVSTTATITSNYNGADLSCAGSTDGSAIANPSGGGLPYTYAWSDGQNTATLADVGAGTYTVSVTDAFGCTATASVTLTNPSNVDADITVNSDYNGNEISCEGGTDGDATANGSGGITPYTYLWSGGQTTANISDANAGTHTVTVTDANGCTATESVVFSEPTPITFIVNSASPSDCGVNDGIILFSASGGTGSYEYSIDGTTWQSSTSFVGLAPGTYFTYVRSTVGSCQVGPRAITVNIPEAPTIDNITLINPTTNVSTDGGILVDASGSGIAIEYSIDGTTFQPSNLFTNLSEGSYTVTVRYFGFTCVSSSPVTLTAGGGVVGQGGGVNYCSDDLSGVQFVETYYIPYPEDQVLTSLTVLSNASCGFFEPQEPIQTYVSVGVVEAGTVITYDHWEDGYESNLSFPIQSTTEIWGDGDISNGLPPGFSSDYLSAADIIILNNAVRTTNRQSIIDFDAGDKLGSRGNLSMTRLAWAEGTSTLLAGALEVYPVLSWGTSFEIPVGVNTNINDMFEYTAVVVMASENNTTVNIDTDGNGSNDVTVNLSEGESHMVNGNVNSGATINSSAPIQVDLITGDICAGHEARFFTIKPTDQWSSDYYNPVATENTGAVGTTDDNHPTYVHLYNPNNSSINVFWETAAGVQGSVSVPSNGTQFIEIQDGTGSHFYTTDNSNFYAIATIDSDPDGGFGNSAHDWGFALVPEGQVSNQITLVGFAPGQDPTACTTASIDKTGWNLHYVDSEETVSETAPATRAFDGNTNTYWHTKYNGGSDPQPHEIQIDLGTDYDISSFRYVPRLSSIMTNTISNNTYVAIDNVNPSTITSTINVPIGGFISDINILNLDVTHTYVNDLFIKLTSPSGTEVTLLRFPCGDDDDILIDIDDAGAAYGSFPCPPVNGAAYQPFGSLADFNGEDVSGVWTLEIQDVFGADGGGLNGWQLQVSTASTGGGTIAGYEFYVSSDGSNWNSAVASGTWANDLTEKRESFNAVNARYIRLVSTSEVNGNPITSVAELDVFQCTPLSNENSAPVWLTAAFPSGSSSTGAITVCVDYNGDGGTLADGNGVMYDAAVVLNNLQNAKIYDPDGDQTGMQIWVCDGSDAIIAGAWGQDPATASPASPAIDLGVGLPNGIPFATSKCVDLSKDYNSNGLYDECDEVIYTVFIRNTGALPMSTGVVNIIDTLPPDVSYIENTTVAIINGVVTNLADESGVNSAFPLDENGYNYSSVIQPGDSVIFRFEAVIGDIASAKFITNTAIVNNGQRELYPEVSFPAQEPTGAILAGMPSDVTVECDAVPTEPVIGSDIYPTNNCEELGVIPQAGWSLQYVDSEQGANPATNAFDGNIGTIWHTEGAPLSPPHPHELQIDLGASYMVSGFRYLPRLAGDNGKIADFEFFVSEDGITWGSALSSGTWSNSISEQEEVFPITRGRFVRLVANSEVNGNPWTSIAELNVLQCVNFAPTTITLTEVSTQTNDGSSTDDCYQITRTWETIDYCGEVSTYTQVITVEDTNDPILVGVPADITVASNAVPEAPLADCSAVTNVAQGKPTNQSSVDSGGQSSRAVDGNTDGNYVGGSVTHTTSEVQPWWEVDLQAVYPIEEIELWNRTDCCTGRLTNYYILVSDQAFASTDLSTTLLDPEVKSYFQSTTAGATTTIAIDTTARYVRIQLQGTDILSLAEVIVTPSCVSATDNCDPDVNITYSEVNVPAGCAYGITRTWTATDNCGNVTTAVQNINVSSTLDVNASITSNYNGRQISCATASDGTASVVISGGVSPLSIDWSDGQTGSNAINLSGTTYSVTVTDANGCTTTDDITLTLPPDITVNTNITSNYGGEDISCIGASDGSAFVIANGGTGAKTYEWSNGQTTANATGLSVGTYTVTATDINGCTSVNSVTLSDPTPLAITTNVTSDYNGEDISCTGAADGTASASASGGTGAITYFWSNSQSGNNISGLLAGTYTVTATDGNGCTIVENITLTDPPPIVITTSGIDPSLCESSDGTVAVSATGGIGSYEFRLGAAGAWQIGNTFTGLSAGTYDFYVRNDDGSCPNGPESVTLNDPVPQSCPIVLTADTLVYCQTDISVSMTIPTSPDATGYTWTVPAGIILVSGQSTDSIVVNMNNVALGFYDICVVTNSNCGDSPSCCTTLEIIACSEICGNGIDDDGDGLIDSEDDECVSCDVIYTTNDDLINEVNPLSAALEDTINIPTLTDATNAIGLDTVSIRFYYVDNTTSNQRIYYYDPNTDVLVNTGVNIPASAAVSALAFNAAGLGYALSDNGDLYSITTNFGGTDIPTVNLLGNVGASVYGDLVLDANGIIWAVSNNDLYRIDPASTTITLVGPITEVGDFGGSSITGLAFSASGDLFASAGNQLYNINFNSLQATLVGAYGTISNDLTSCAFPVFTPNILVTKQVLPVGAVNPGDTLTYTIITRNTGSVIITGATLTDGIPSGTFYVENTSTLNGNSISDVAGNMPFATGGLVNSDGLGSGTIVSGNNSVVTFKVVTDCCSGLTSISNQGSVNYNEALAPVLSDDPTVVGTTNPTVNSISTLAAPVVVTPASNLNLSCDIATNTTAINNWLSSNGGASATVNCGAITWTHDYTGLSDLCGATGTATVIFTATNDCGDDNTTTAMITVTDNVDPVWDIAPSDITIECDGTNDPSGAIAAWLASNGTTGSASDACSNVNYTNDYTVLSDLCGATGTALVTFTATDDCGNDEIASARVTVQDTTDPVWTTDPSDITIECDGTTDPGGAIAAWLASFGTTGVVTDACGIVTVTNDYVALTSTGCAGTGSATVIFTATDDCSLTTTRSAVLTIVDTTAPTLTSVADITVDCDDVPAPIAPTPADDCDPSVDVVYQEVTVYHPNANWKSGAACSLIHSVTDASYNNMGTGSTADDEMSFILTVIGQNTGSTWTANVNGTIISGDYYKTYNFGPILSGGSILNFTIVDDADPSCTLVVTLNAADF